MKNARIERVMDRGGGLWTESLNFDFKNTFECKCKKNMHTATTDSSVIRKQAKKKTKRKPREKSNIQNFEWYQNNKRSISCNFQRIFTVFSTNLIKLHTKAVALMFKLFKTTSPPQMPMFNCDASKFST